MAASHLTILTVKPARKMGLAVLILSLLAVFVGTVLPQSAIAWLRNQVPPFALIWDSLDALMPWFNPLHIILYVWIASLWRVFLPTARTRWILLFGAVFAVVSETFQLLVPGRTARIGDVFNDLLGIAIGLALVAVIRKLMLLSSREQ